MKTSQNYQNHDLNLFEIMRPYLSNLDNTISQNLSTQVPFIDSVVNYIISAGGKRLRPIVLICLALALDKNSNQKNIYILAAVIEFIHTATLLHDDVVDESNLRRTKPTVNAVFGNAPAVLVGDFLYSRAFEMMVSVNNLTIMQVLAKTTNIIAQGEVLQLINIGNIDINLTTYLEVIYYKTAKLFEASSEIAAILCNKLDFRAQARDYGRYLGCAFQLIDDYLDYGGNTQTMGKEIGDDLRQGKITMPIIYLLEQGSIEQKQFLIQEIENIKQGNLVNIPKVIELIKNSNALEYTKQQAILESQKAKQAIEDLDDNIYKQCLYKICDMAIERLF